MHSDFQTIQKLASDVGVDESYIRKMIKNHTLTAHKMRGYKRIFIDISEFNSLLQPVDKNDVEINLDNFLI